MIEVIRGISKNPEKENQLEFFLKKLYSDGVLYFGYPILPIEEEAVNIDACYISENKGLIIFSFSEEKTHEKLNETLDTLFSNINSKLYKEKSLIKNRNLQIEVSILNFSLSNVSGNDRFNNYDSLKNKLNTIIWKNGKDYYCKLLSSIQNLGDFKYKKNKDFKNKNSKAKILFDLENQISTLDYSQNKAILETTDSPQRIRGLAGSGKTIVLALKVAYLHTSHPDWKIVICYNSRSLYNQFKNLIERFTIKIAEKKPNFNNVLIMHVWGSSQRQGLYFNICRKHKVKYFNFKEAENTYGSEKALQGIYSRLKKEIVEFNIMYDAILIDEAQDLPIEFFQICYHILGKDKRIIWAYDELQSLNNIKMLSPEKLFGNNSNGKSYVKLHNKEGKPKEDIILKTCYRNSKKILTTAHALGFGIYRKTLDNKNQLVQMFGDTRLWEEIGYEVVNGDLAPGKYVELRRSLNSSPLYLEESSKKEDIIIFNKFETPEKQSDWIAKQIKKNLEIDELDYKDILIIYPDPKNMFKKTKILEEKLKQEGIEINYAKNESFYEENKITISHIYRAKGNEAAMVYLMDAHYCYDGYELIKKRNILFTAITRTKSWVRVTGINEKMQRLINEYNCIKKNNYILKFEYPSEEEQLLLNTIHRDRTEEEMKKIQQDNSNIESVKEIIQNKDFENNDVKLLKLRELKKLLNEHLN